MALLHDDVRDEGLDWIKAIADANNLDLHICSQEPTTFLQAETTYSLGQKENIACTAPGADGSDGRRVQIAAVTDGVVDGTDDATHQVLIDTDAETIVGWQLLSGGGEAVTSGNTFTTSAFYITIPDTA